jgi:hypothetical protein
MRKIYKSFTDKKEVEDILKNRSGKLKLKSNQNKFVKKILNKLKEDFEFTINRNSYYIVEQRQSGHNWHKDTGSNNHMTWCQVGVSILLKDGDSGGETYYADDDKETNKIKSNRKLYDLVAHTSDEWHMVTPHTGERVVFLMFI